MIGGDWTDVSRRGAFASHRLVGWIYWDPVAIANYAALGVPEGFGYYVATRGAPLAGAGSGAVAAAFGSIHPEFVAVSLDLCRSHTTFDEAARARDAAVVDGLRRYVPEICDDFAAMAGRLWDAADALPEGGCVLFAAHRDWPRPDDPLLSAWLAVNCIRERRGDLHWAIQNAEGLSMTAAMVLDGAWRHYDDDWLPKSRGSDDDAVAAALHELTIRGLAEGGRVNEIGRRYRQELEDRLDELTVEPWRHLGDDTTARFLDMVEPVGDRLIARIDETAGPLWMPAGRVRRTADS